MSDMEKAVEIAYMIADQAAMNKIIACNKNPIITNQLKTDNMVNFHHMIQQFIQQESKNTKILNKLIPKTRQLIKDHSCDEKRFDKLNKSLDKLGDRMDNWHDMEQELTDKMEYLKDFIGTDIIGVNPNTTDNNDDDDDHPPSDQPPVVPSLPTVPNHTPCSSLNTSMVSLPSSS